jgi:hypothetical protein
VRADLRRFAVVGTLLTPIGTSQSFRTQIRQVAVFATARPINALLLLDAGIRCCLSLKKDTLRDWQPHAASRTWCPCSARRERVRVQPEEPIFHDRHGTLALDLLFLVGQPDAVCHGTPDRPSHSTRRLANLRQVARRQPIGSGGPRVSIGRLRRG